MNRAHLYAALVEVNLGGSVRLLVLWLTNLLQLPAEIGFGVDCCIRNAFWLWYWRNSVRLVSRYGFV